MLGIIVGVYSVVTLVALVQGVKNFVSDQFNSLGSNLILVAPGRIGFDKDPTITFSNNKLTVSDADNINSKLQKYIVGASPNIRLTKTVSYKKNKFLANIVGANYRFLDITNFEIDKGRAFTKLEQQANSEVAVVGPAVAKELFGSTQAVGKKLKIGEHSFEIVGTFKSKGINSDERIVIPFTTLQKSLGIKKLSGITIKARAGVNIDEAIFNIRLVMLSNHKKDEFDVVSQKDIVKSVDSILKTLSLALGAVAGISLVVGGIGIMNIMLVSINERINEIGLRKALGATSSDIGKQFLLESVFLSLAGGLLGLGLGVLTTLAVRSVLRAEVTGWSVALAIVFSLVVGVAFGTFPAISASKKDAIEALRFEL